MPRAGQRLLSTDFPAAAHDVHQGTFEVSATGEWGAEDSVSSGDYIDCGTSFIAPTSGAVVIHFHAELNKAGDGGSTIRMCPEVREGGSVGQGPVVASANINDGLSCMAGDSSSDSPNSGRSGFMVVTGLTPGRVYNTRMMHRVSSGTNGIVRVRSILVQGLT
ncbi:hypothetical protein J4H86_21110 [Spiractinospora alimapuensis]|uniref:hypothetical protein n=1 Tax=Spiractinospora alimapuensis TaxID=2820884 RepID=UPI001F2C15D3|nr:hypothetical protein [Spiractinospora alimapuensis]QVQ51294.1 hypothetical protein J4H86_21110 [Spiractinospora alimapuensis]